MLTASQLIEKVAHRQLRQKIRLSLQPGTLNAIASQEISSIIMESLNVQLVAERDQVLDRACYERVEGSPKRNGFKLVKLPGLWGPMILRRPVLRSG